MAGGWATVHRHDVTTHQLADGSVLRIDLGNDSTVAAANPGDAVFQGHAILTLDHATQRVVVTVTRSVPTSFLRIVGLSVMRVSATATAEVQHGIAEGSSS